MTKDENQRKMLTKRAVEEVASFMGVQAYTIPDELRTIRGERWSLHRAISIAFEVGAGEGARKAHIEARERLGMLAELADAISKEARHAHLSQDILTLITTDISELRAVEEEAK